MPNHINNILTIHEYEEDDSADFEDIVEKVKGEDTGFDFNKIIPMPENSETFFVTGGLGEKEREKFGENNWYDWSIENWGTKWNAYDIRINKYGTIVFQTAWSHPYKIVDALSKMFPKNSITVAYADEDKGYNLGIYKIKNGKLLHQIDLDKLSQDDKDLLADVIWGAEKFTPLKEE